METMGTFAICIIIAGLVGLLLSTILVYKRLNLAQLSMNVFGGGIIEHHQGLSIKPPWFTLQQPEITMNAEIVVTSGGIQLVSWESFMAGKMYEKIATRAYETMDSVVFGAWATAIRPRRGGLEQFVKKTPGTAAIMVMAEIDIALSDRIANMETENVLSNKKALGELVARVFGGNDEEADSPVEHVYGVIVSNPKLFDLDLGKRSQDAKEKLFEAKKFRQAIGEMMTDGGITDPEKAADVVLTATGVAKKQIFQVEGLEGALKSVAGAAEAFFRRRS